MKRYTFFGIPLSYLIKPLTQRFFNSICVLVILETRCCFLRRLTCGFFRLRRERVKRSWQMCDKTSWSFGFPYQPDRTDRNRRCCTFSQACFWQAKVQSGRTYEAISRGRWVGTNCFNPRSLADECCGNNANWMTSSFSQGYLFNFIKSVPSKGVRHFGYGSECF